ncbi:MAG: hypothetical protein ACXACD_07370 [Candidatus Thorarchaeota archaeon]
MADTKQLINEARQRGREYLPIYRGCAPATFCAVADTLQMPVSAAMFKMMSAYPVFQVAVEESVAPQRQLAYASGRVVTPLKTHPIALLKEVYRRRLSRR